MYYATKRVKTWMWLVDMSEVTNCMNKSACLNFQPVGLRYSPYMPKNGLFLYFSNWLACVLYAFHINEMKKRNTFIARRRISRNIREIILVFCMRATKHYSNYFRGQIISLLCWFLFANICTVNQITGCSDGIGAEAAVDT